MGAFFVSEESKASFESLQGKLAAAPPGANIAVTHEEMAALRDSVAAPEQVDRADVEMFFRCIMQMARHLAKKYDFTIKQWPEK